MLVYSACRYAKSPCPTFCSGSIITSVYNLPGSAVNEMSGRYVVKSEAV